DAVHEATHGARLPERVVAEDARLAAVVQEQSRQKPDQRRLARAVLAENRDALAALDREGDVVQRDAAPRVDALLPPDELLAQVVNLDCDDLLLQTRRRDTDRAPRRVVRRGARETESAEEQHRRGTIAKTLAGRKSLVHNLSCAAEADPPEVARGLSRAVEQDRLPGGTIMTGRAGPVG